MRTIKAGLLYFAMVFAAGFALAPIRLMWLQPRVGARAAELLELPLMLAVCVLAARWVVVRVAVPASPASRLAVGAVALASMLVAEFGVVVPLRGLSVAQHLAGRDPVSGAAYYLALLLFGLMPLLLRSARGRFSASGSGSSGPPPPR